MMSSSIITADTAPAIYATGTGMPIGEDEVVPWTNEEKLLEWVIRSLLHGVMYSFP